MLLSSQKKEEKETGLDLSKTFATVSLRKKMQP